MDYNFLFELGYYAAVVIITIYIIASICVNGGIPPSISETYYVWKKRNRPFLFTFVMTAVSFLFLPYWFSVCKEWQTFLPFLSVSGMLFVGGACAFKETLTRGVHFTSAGIWAASAVTFFAVNQMWLPMLLGVIYGFGSWAVFKFQNLTFWAEVACVTMMIVGLGML